MEPIWQNSEIRFDAPAIQLKFRKGEKLIDNIPDIEDTKGNPDEGGTFKFTNLRLLWYSDTNSAINLSIGYDSITSFEVKANYSGSHGNSTLLNLRCKFNNSKFEFIFTSRSKESNRMGPLFQTIKQAYESTKLFRDIRMRGAIIQDKDIVLLPGEMVVNKYNGVWNLSSETSNVGTFVITNVRIVWYHSTSENFNASIPYIQIKSVKKKDSKAGPAVVVETFPQGGENKGYTIGFQSEQMSQIMTELSKLHKLYFLNPYFGIENLLEERIGSRGDVDTKRGDEDIEVIESEYNERNHNIMNYMTSAAGKEGDKEVVFSTELGLAIEKPPQGLNIEHLWKILNVAPPSKKEQGL